MKSYSQAQGINLSPVKTKTCISPDVIERQNEGKCIRIAELYRKKIRNPSNNSNTNRSISDASSSFIIQRRNFSPIVKFHKRSINLYPQEIKSPNAPMEEFKISQIVPNLKQRSSKKPRSYLHSRIKKKNNASLPLREEIKIMIQKKRNEDTLQCCSKVMKPGEIKICITPKGSHLNNSEFSDAAEKISNGNNLSVNSATQNLFFQKPKNFEHDQVLNVSKNFDTVFKKAGPILFKQQLKMSQNTPNLSKLSKLQSIRRGSSPWKSECSDKSLTLRATNSKLKKTRLVNSFFSKDLRNSSKDGSKSYLKSLLQAKKCLRHVSQSRKMGESLENILLTNEYLNQKLSNYKIGSQAAVN